MLTGLAMFQANPFLGVGFANYTDNYFAYAEDLGVETDIQDVEVRREPHSLYIEIMAETGALGMLTFMGFLGLLFSGMYQVRKRYLKSNLKSDVAWAPRITAIMFSLLSFLVAGFFLHGIGFRYIWVLAGMALAIIHIANNEKHQNRILQSFR
jgi:O-antigen ligase